MLMMMLLMTMIMIIVKTTITTTTTVEKRITSEIKKNISTFFTRYILLRKLTQTRTFIQQEFVCWLLNVPATCYCISGTYLFRQFYVLPH